MPPNTGAHAWFRGPAARLRLQHRSPDTLALQVQTRALSLTAEMDLAAAPPWLLAIGRIEGAGLAHATQKSPALPVRGQLRVAGQTLDLDGAWACVDSSNGLLARHTEWRWASAHRPGLGFNLQSGYFGAQENALWLDGQLIPLGPAHFNFDAEQPLAPWHVHTEDGLLDLTFTPEGARQQDRELLVAASHYVQPVGTFSGWVRAVPDAPAQRVEELLGVTEDHRSRW